MEIARAGDHFCMELIEPRVRSLSIRPHEVVEILEVGTGCFVQFHHLRALLGNASFEPCVHLLEPRVHLVEPAINLLEPRIDGREALVHLRLEPNDTVLDRCQQTLHSHSQQLKAEPGLGDD